MANDLLEPVRLPINNLINVVTSRRQGMEMAKKLGFSLPEATKIAVVISELARNITMYAESGIITLIPYNGERKGMKIIAQDKGPGIEDVNRVLAGGYTTSKGLGMGISGSKKIMDEFEIQTVIGGGTTIKAAKWLN
ncbi:MAG: anti-sigma regulatory factor [Anaerolineae bacterium]|nr:anti-sigma regulatory factor [Anaerolineae bacterium]